MRHESNVYVSHRRVFAGVVLLCWSQVAYAQLEQPAFVGKWGTFGSGDGEFNRPHEPTGNLDSTNGEAVMQLLDTLHQEGATICMVTHDPRYAKHAGRAIQLFDGQVVNGQAPAA